MTYPADTTATMRVATWNILWVPEERERRLDGIAGSLSALNPDVVCLQEAWDGSAQALAGQLGLHVAAQSRVTVNPDYPADSNVAVLTRWTPIETHSDQLPAENFSSFSNGYVRAVFAHPSGTPVAVHSAHLAWGSGGEPVRVAQALHIERRARELESRNPGIVQVLGGDFNTLPESSTVRFLTGLEGTQGEGTLWVDAWATSGDGTKGATSDPLLPLAQDTARSVGITDVHQLPSRRIDYLLSRGWVYGRPGFPVSISLISGGDMSDHHGLVADFRL